MPQTAKLDFMSNQSVVDPVRIPWVDLRYDISIESNHLSKGRFLRESTSTVNQ